MIERPSYLFQSFLSFQYITAQVINTIIETIMATIFTASILENDEPETIISTSPTDKLDPSSFFEKHL